MYITLLDSSVWKCAIYFEVGDRDKIGKIRELIFYIIKFSLGGLCKCSNRTMKVMIIIILILINTIVTIKFMIVSTQSLPVCVNKIIVKILLLKSVVMITLQIVVISWLSYLKQEAYV